MDLGSRVKERRTQRGLSQEKLAHAAGVTMSSIQRLESGFIRDPHYSTLSGIAHVLGTTVAELVGEEPRARPAAGPGHLHIYRTWGDIEAALSLDQIVEIVKGMEDGRISVREDQARRVQELLQEVEEASKLR